MKDEAKGEEEKDDEDVDALHLCRLRSTTMSVPMQI